MSKPWKIIQELETDNSRLFKESVVEKNLNDKTFQEGLAKTIDWYFDNSEWLKNVTSGEYQNYYKSQYN